MRRHDLPMSRARHFSSDPSAWGGRITIGLGWGYFHGSIGDIEPHQHHAIQIVLARSPLQIWLSNVGWRKCHGVVIGADVAHQLAGTGQAMKMVYMEPEHDQARRITQHFHGRLHTGWRELSRAEVLALWDLLEASGGMNLTQVLADALCPVTSDSDARSNDALIQQLLHDLPRPLPEKVTVQQLARAVHLSPSRFQHRFAQSTGMALRPYLRWLRLLTALTAIGRDASLTEAAVDAGFADAAHFSRTFRRHFGFTPRHLLRLRFIV